MSMTPSQCRAARAFLNISQSQLAQCSGVALRTITHFESGNRLPRRATRMALRHALESAGIEFLDGDAPGVRCRARV